MIGQMELELGLALPNHNPMMIEGLDLNSSNDNGLEIENTSRLDFHQKRRFHDDLKGIEVESKLSLLSWSGGRQPEDDSCRRSKSRRLQVNHEGSDNEENQEIEVWPPINSSRNHEMPHHHQGGFTAAKQMRNSTCVKVKMEGVAIGRKIDLRHYDSYQDLTNTLINMFTKYRNREKYTLLYQDKGGDWMLLGDVQWERFVESVQRLEILKKDNKMGCGLLSRKYFCKI